MLSPLSGQGSPLPVSSNTGGNWNRLQLCYSGSLAFHPFPILPTLTVGNTDGQWQIEQKAVLFHCASCWQQFGVWVNEVQPQSITGFSAHRQTTVCAVIDRQSPKLAVIGSISVIRRVNLPICAKSIKICMSPMQDRPATGTCSCYFSSSWQPLITCFLFFSYNHPFNGCFRAQRLLSTLGTILNIYLSVPLLCDLLSNLDTFISGVLHWNSYIFYDYCSQNDTVRIGLYSNNDTWLDGLLSKSQAEISIRWFWLSYWRVSKIVYCKYLIQWQG